jgi:hypothetical protein
MTAIGRGLSQTEYEKIRDECVIVTASDAKHAPYLLNAIASFDQTFPDRPRIIVYDLGLSTLARLELNRTTGIEVRPTPSFVPHWRLNWSWKLHALSHDLTRYVLYLDLPNFVVLRSLATWFLSIRKNGYLVVSNGQRLGDITPSDYWSIHGLTAGESEYLETFGAGIIGYDIQSPAYAAIQKSLSGVRSKLNLGRSLHENNRNYKPNIVRDCRSFRADQTLLNLNFRGIFGEHLNIRRPSRYCGQGGPADHPDQYLWYARRNIRSLTHVFRVKEPKLISFLNRSLWYLRINSLNTAKRILRR